MVGSIFYLVPLCSVLLVAWADDRILLTEEDERLWNTPPELVPEQAVKMSELKNRRLLSIPITTNINVNAGNNAHSLGFQVRPESASYSDSNSFGQLLSPVSGTTSQSQSVSFTAGLNGIAGAVSEAVNHFYPIHGNRKNINIPPLGVSSAAAASSATTIGSSHSSASPGAVTIGVPQRPTTIRFPASNQNRPIWTNIRPNHNNNGRPPSRMPTLEIEVTPNRERHHNHKPITLHVSTEEPRWRNTQPRVHIRKWQPNYRGFYSDEEI